MAKYKSMEEMMGSKEWSATDKAGRKAMIGVHGFGKQQQEAAAENRKINATRRKSAAPPMKSPWMPGVAGKAQRLVLKPGRLDELVDALDQSKRGKK